MAYLGKLLILGSSFEITTEHGPSYRKTIKYWINRYEGGYRIQKSEEGAYKRTHRRRTYKPTEIGPVFSTYEEAIPELASLLTSILEETNTFSNDLFGALRERHEQEE